MLNGVPSPVENEASFRNHFSRKTLFQTRTRGTVEETPNLSLKLTPQNNSILSKDFMWSSLIVG